MRLRSALLVLSLLSEYLPFHSLSLMSAHFVSATGGEGAGGFLGDGVCGLGVGVGGGGILGESGGAS